MMSRNIKGTVHANDTYTMTTKCIGAGVSGRIKQIRSSQMPHAKLVVKTARESAKAKSKWIAEQLLKWKDHDNILKLIDYQIHATYAHYFILERMDQCLDTYCEQRITPIPESLRVHILKEISKGLNFIHKQACLHRDVKCANVLISFNSATAPSDNWHYIVKIADFDTLISLEDVKYDDEIVGTYYYRAPELILGRRYDNKVDMWALGCILGTIIKAGHAKYSFAKYGEKQTIACGFCPNMTYQEENKYLLRVVLSHIGMPPRETLNVDDDLYDSLTVEVQNRIKRYDMKSLVSTFSPLVENKMLIDLLQQLLHFIPSSRPSAGDVLNCLQTIKY